MGLSVRIRGIVQGVGFRPAVWRIARQYKLRGAVWNDAQGVMIHAWGEPDNLQAFITALSEQAPPEAWIDRLETGELDLPCRFEDFRILSSRSRGPSRTAIAADVATCTDCQKEIFDSRDRRFLYPFTNCINCGPRLSIITGIPYDRAKTSMAEFKMCSLCQTEYDRPSDRRFHAQANTCPECGPRLWLEDKEETKQQLTDVIEQTCRLIQQGMIVAIKGLGGFHLACAADNELAVSKLRRRKFRYEKPFALMARDLTMIRRYARVNKMEQEQLQQSAAPIVILQSLEAGIAKSVAPDDNKLGFMLPYTPLHHLLMHSMTQPVVMTSGNKSHEPQCIDNDEARQQLSEICDFFLLHDREIINRLDDSVIRIMDGQPRIIRRARGFSPKPIELPSGLEHAPSVLGMGGEVKNTFCLLGNGQSVMSQYLGDLENTSVFQDFRRHLTLYQHLFDFNPEVVAVDLHPDYLSTRRGRELAKSVSIPIEPVQHHHAHIAACMAENGLPADTPPVLGIVYDGLGMGENGQLWGGEFLLADYREYTRLAHFQPIPMPGGVQAIREPWRNTYAQLTHYFDWEELKKRYFNLEVIRFLDQKPLSNLDLMISRSINSPLSSSCGRWFDAFAAALGLSREQVNYEGQAAIGLENLALSTSNLRLPTDFAYRLKKIGPTDVLDWKPLWESVLSDLEKGVAVQVIAARIHIGLATATIEEADKLCRLHHTHTVVLSGGVFQNRLVLEAVSEGLRSRGKTVLSPVNFPANDGGLALGQAIVAVGRKMFR